MDWKDRFRDELYEPPLVRTCSECLYCDMPEKGLYTDSTVAKCTDANEWIHSDWIVDGECETFTER